MATVVVKTREAYSGEKNRQLREGFGVYTYENKYFKYEGEWKAGRKHGHGKLMMADGSYYEGEFQNGEIEGHGFRYWSGSKNRYSGQFHMGELHGQGVMNYTDGSVYEGEWYRNKRQGYGVFKSPDSSVYQGYLHEHKRHGEGTQIYSNGDRYDGDWVLDKRQGHGELRCKDGTIYDGQWRNDMFNGQGTITHPSGMVYEGLWVNGKPAQMASKLVFKCASPLEVLQNVPFSIEVECQDEEGGAVLDHGREIRIMAGFKYMPPKDGSTASSRENTGTGLFDMIEDVEETPIETPFGYSIVSYPLTDQVPDNLLGGLESRVDTEVTETEEEEPKTEETEQAETAEEKDKQDEGDAKSKEPPESGATPGDASEAKTDTLEPTPRDKPVTPLPPPAINLRTSEGSVVFPTLMLSAAPPMYRPFTIMEEDEKGRRSKAKSIKKKEEEDRAASRIKREKTNVADERFARPGEYVLMVQDVTSPPFMGVTLTPAFIQVRVSAPKKAKKAPKQKEKGPKWDTARHIAESMARGYSDMAKQEMG